MTTLLISIIGWLYAFGAIATCSAVVDSVSRKSSLIIFTVFWPVTMPLLAILYARDSIKRPS